jgi:hypothetical protein
MKLLLVLTALVIMAGSAAAQQLSCDPNGDYVCSDGCKDGFKDKQTRVAISGNSVILINEFGLQTTGSLSGGIISIPGWNATAIISPTCNRLTFSVHNTIWTR